MTAQATLGFLLNAAWQVPVLAAGAMALAHVTRATPQWRCRIWSACLALALVVPLDFGQVAMFHRNEGSMRPRTAVPWPRAVEPSDPPLPRLDVNDRESGARFTLSQDTADLLLLLYLAATSISFAALLVRIARAQRLKQESKEVELRPELANMIASFMSARRLNVPAVRTNALTRTPAVVGIANPAIIVPADFAEYSAEQAAAALLHECAHIVRRDYRSALICELMALPLRWHPIIPMIMAQIGADRELASDALASRQMADPSLYARSLVEVARKVTDRMPQFALALPLLGRATLTSRVTAILEPSSCRQSGALRALACAILLPGTLASVTLLRWTPSIALETKELPSIAARAPYRSRAADAAAIKTGRAAAPNSQGSIGFTGADGIDAPRFIVVPNNAGQGPISARPDSLEQPPVPAQSGEALSVLDANGIDARELSAFAQAGYSSLSPDDLISLHYNGVTSDMVRRLTFAGFAPFTPRELLSLRFNGVSAREIDALGRIGGRRLAPADIVRIHYGATTEFLERLARQGFKGLSADEILQAYFSGSDPHQ